MDEVLNGTYSINIKATDYGSGVDKAIIKFDQIIHSVDKNAIEVTEVKKTTDWKDPDFNEKEFSLIREVKDIYLSDEYGNIIDEPSQYITIELDINPNDGSPFTYSPITGYNTWCDPYYLTFCLKKDAQVIVNGSIISSLNIEKNYTSRYSPTDVFEKVMKSYQGVDYNIAYYKPNNKSDKLIVWLNGAGEGGSSLLGNKTNVEITLLGNKVTALVEDKFQNLFDGCHVLVPQCPTMWMDDGKGNTVAGHRHSIYQESLVELIDDYIKNNNINKVIISGCSNGGYMTMNIAMDYGLKYQAYVANCEAMNDDNISDEDIQILKDLPLYMIYSRDDNLVNPELYEIPTIRRIKKVGGKNLHVSTTDHVIDTSGLYKKESGEPYTYLGHWSWIYFFNDECSCDECGIKVFNWLKSIIK